MIILAGAVLGIVIGATTALQRGGKLLDAMHYAAGFGVAGTLLALLATIILERSLIG